MSGFWLTWYYFGYSSVYGSIIALVQIVGGCLLLSPRLALLGALLLTPVAINIVLIDLFYGIDLGGLFAAVLLLALLAACVIPHLRRLGAVIIQPAARVSLSGHALRVALLVTLCGFTYWIANYNNRAPTPIDGVWEPAVPLTGDSTFDRLFFERNRAHMVVFRYPPGRYVTADFRFDGTSRLTISRQWLHPDIPLWSGELASDRQTLRLWRGDSSTSDTIVLRRRPPATSLDAAGLETTLLGPGR